MFVDGFVYVLVDVEKTTVAAKPTPMLFFFSAYTTLMCVYMCMYVYCTPKIDPFNEFFEMENQQNERE